MAYVSTQKTSKATVGERLGSIALGFGKRVNDYRLYRRTLTELQSMNSRELADLGLHPALLSQIAREAVYGSQK